MKSRNTPRDLNAEAEAAKAENEKLSKALEKSFAKTFGTGDGKIVLEHLCRQFGLTERSAVKDANGAVCAIRSAIREGEKSAIFHILRLTARGKGEQTATIPIP